jgi:hypothetical protein
VERGQLMHPHDRTLHIMQILLFSPLRRQVFREGARLVLTIASSVFVWAGVFQVGLPCAPPPYVCVV